MEIILTDEEKDFAKENLGRVWMNGNLMKTEKDGVELELYQWSSNNSIDTDRFFFEIMNKICAALSGSK